MMFVNDFPMIEVSNSDPRFVELATRHNETLNAFVPGREYVYDTKNTLPNLDYVVLVLDGKRAIATSALMFVDKTTAEIMTVHIHSDYRDRGIVRALCNHLEQVATERGCTNVILDTWEQLVPAVKLYESLGYERYDGEILHPIDKDCIYMRKGLAEKGS
ncbi:MAG: GNAT family N-acetyltransferase [Firmicutes bacterium]|nr:GNAT family N-acetyltransferase [Bacillota bacterium]